MLAIAGGVTLGILGVIAILWLVSAVIENQAEVAQGCALILGLIVIIGVWVWLDNEWPEIFSICDGWINGRRRGVCG